ncbi:MAG: HAD-IIB family hydrolase [Microcoleaceae cyanobacterium]
MLIIFTDLDGTLLNADNYRCDAALPIIQQLQDRQIPIIPVTSKTRAEVELLCQEIKLRDSFIVENGSAIFIPRSQTELADCSSEFNTTESKDYSLIQFGCSYAEAVQGVTALAQDLGVPLRGFNDLEVTEVIQRTGLSLIAATWAKTREFTEPFITPKEISGDVIQRAVEQLGFQVVIGDRFSHLIGKNAGKGRATQWLTQQYQTYYQVRDQTNHQTNSSQTLSPEVEIITVGLGNSPNDLAMLEVVDVPIIIPDKNGPHPDLMGRGWQVADTAGALGWARAVAAVCG